MYMDQEIQLKEKIGRNVMKKLVNAKINTPFQHIAQIKYSKIENQPYIRISDYSLEETSSVIPKGQSQFTDLLRNIPEFIQSIHFDNYRDDTSLEFLTDQQSPQPPKPALQAEFFQKLFATKPLVGVVGASSQKINIGRKLINKLIHQRVPVFAISNKKIPDIDTYTLKQAPIPDILLIASPADSVQAIIDAYPDIPKIVFSAGFEDNGKQKLTGKNFIGPNSVGFVSAIDMTFFDEIYNKTKQFGVISDSGAVLGKLAKSGGCGVSVGNASAISGSDFIDILSKKFEKIAVYLEKENPSIINNIQKNTQNVFYGFFGGTTEQGKQRALQHSGKCLSTEFQQILENLPNFHSFSTLTALNFAVSKPRITNLITVSQSGYIATRFADFVRCGRLSTTETAFISEIFEKFRVPAAVSSLLDCTPQLPAAELARIVYELSRGQNFVLVSFLPGLMSESEKLAVLEVLKQVEEKEKVCVAVENDMEFGAKVQEIGFEVFADAESMGQVVGEKQRAEE